MMKGADVVSGLWLLAAGQRIPGWFLSDLNLFVYNHVHLHTHARSY